MFNVVKVECVPLNSMFFRRAARLRPERAVIGDREVMPINARPGLLVAGGVAAALPLAAVLIVVTTGSTPTATDADQVRAVLDGMNGSYNRSDFEAFASHVCLDMLRAAGYEAGWYQSRESDGPTQITVNSVDVTGDGDLARAVANVRFVAANHDAKTLDIDFLREGSQWKACRYRPTRSL
jgi:ketosteroid isomerase-like protein